LLFGGLIAGIIIPVRAAEVPIRFRDSATGFAVQPDQVEVRWLAPGLTRSWTRSQLRPNGRENLALEPGRHRLTVVASGYRVMSGDLEAGDSPYRLEFNLDPVEVPREIQPDSLTALRRVNETVFVGYVAGDEDGRPLADVIVRAEPSGNEARTDARGFFQIYVPVQSRAEAATSPARLSFSKPGHRPVEHQYLELWSEGNWVYRVALERGGGKTIVDERQLRRRSSYPAFTSENLPASSAAGNSFADPSGDIITPADADGPIVQAASTTETIRIPTNIRVLRQDGATVDYLSLQTYCQRSLASEVYASWGDYSGGSNSLQAVAVAIRTFAVGYVNNPVNSAYDICGTTSCQAYNHAASAPQTTAAVNATANYVMFKPGDGRVGFKLTEYSAENNQLGNACGDGYTAPTGGCLYDPVCAGEDEFGHGRGLCQWGTAKWATGRKFPGNNFSNTAVTNGHPKRDWVWLCAHYYPQLLLVQGAPLAIGDDVKVLGVANLSVRQCVGNTITSGTNCAQITTKPSGTIGTIIGGPVLVTGDGAGHTWWRVDWGDTNGWSVENYLERVSAAPPPPGTLSATAISAYQINLTWTDLAANEIGTYLERASSSGGPWIDHGFVGVNVTSFSDTNLNPNTAYFYRVRAFNQSDVSAYSNITNATTLGLPPVLVAISNRTIVEGALLTFTNSVTVTDFVSEVTDAESYSAGTAVMFRVPNFSGSTSAFLSNSPNVCAVASSLPAGNSSTRVIRVNWAFTNAPANPPWLRLTTASATTLPNPIIDVTKRFRFRIWTDKALRVGLGIRETTNAPGTPIGANGGNAGGIEWVGITNSISGQPQPNRLVAASNWTTVEFNLPVEPARNFASGNGILSTASGLAVLEHLAFVPAAGNTSYDVYLDDFEVFTPNALTYSLSNAPAGAGIGAGSGVFAWTPAEAQGPGVYNLGVIVTDSSVPPQSDLESFSITVTESNLAPVLTPIASRLVHAGMLVTFTNTAGDADLPVNSLTYGLVPGAPVGAAVGTNSGVFSWLTSDLHVGSSNYITVSVADNGVPPLNDAESFSVVVQPRPAIQSAAVTGTDFQLQWSAIAGVKYRVQFKNALDDASWTDLVPEVTAVGAVANFSDPVGAGQRFYRVSVSSP